MYDFQNSADAGMQIFYSEEEMDLSGFNQAIANSAMQVQALGASIEENKRIEYEDKIRKEKQEEDNHDNLDFLAKNAQETIEILQDMNNVLKRNNELLEEKNEGLENTLSAIYEILGEIFEVNLQNGYDQKELLQQANALACEISATLDCGEKVDWKDKAADGGVQVVISAIGILLKMKGII